MNRSGNYMRILTFLLPAMLFAVACSQPSRQQTVVTGKVVYGNLAIEGAEINIRKMEPSTGLRSGNGEWKMQGSARSGYHGSFRLHLAEGTYRLEARTILRSGEKDVNLSGILEPLNISPGKGRMDQLVIELGAGNIKQRTGMIE